MGFYYSIMGDLENAIKYLTNSTELVEVISNERIIGLTLLRLNIIVTVSQIR